MRKRTRVVSDFDGFDVICILPKLTNKSKRVTYQERKNERITWKNLNGVPMGQINRTHIRTVNMQSASESVTLEIKLTLTVCVCV